MTSKVRRKYSTEFHRRDVVARWRASGLSQAEFCRRENVPEWGLSHWKRMEEANTPLEKDQPQGKPPAKQKERIAYWKKVIEDYRKSGLGPSEFCRRHGIKLVTFKRWRNRLSNPAFPTKPSKKSLPKENPFVPVQLIPPSAGESVEIVLASGAKVQVTEQTSLQLLAKILRALEAKC